jgi:hypothetical protein
LKSRTYFFGTVAGQTTSAISPRHVTCASEGFERSSPRPSILRGGWAGAKAVACSGIAALAFVPFEKRVDILAGSNEEIGPHRLVSLSA